MTVTREPYPVPAWKRSVPGEFKKSWENKGRGNSPSQFLMDVCGKKIRKTVLAEGKANT